MQKTSSRAQTKAKETEDSQETAESSVLEETDTFLDEVDKLLEDQEALTNYKQRGGQ